MTDDKHLTCECTVSYRYVTRPDGRVEAVWDQEPPAFSTMMWGRCERCKLPFHTEFTREEPDHS